jgi:hypothetical protein
LLHTAAAIAATQASISTDSASAPMLAPASRSFNASIVLRSSAVLLTACNREPGCSAAALHNFSIHIALLVLLLLLLLVLLAPLLLLLLLLLQSCLVSSARASKITKCASCAALASGSTCCSSCSSDCDVQRCCCTCGTKHSDQFAAVNVLHAFINSAGNAVFGCCSTASSSCWPIWQKQYNQARCMSSSL